MYWLIAVIISSFSVCLSKFEKISGFLSFICLGISMGIPNYATNGDAVVYANNYMLQTHEFEAGYNFISDFFGNYYDYATFRLITSILFCFILYLGVSCITKKVSLFSLLYCICAFPYDTLQVRSEMALSMIIFGCFFLFKYQRKGIIPSTIIIYIASLFHSLALIFLLIPILYIFVEFIIEKRKLIFSILSLVAIFLKMVGTTKIGNIVTQLVSQYSTRDDAGKNTSLIYNSGTDWVIWIVVFCFSILLAYYTVNQKYIGLDSNIKRMYKVLVLAILVWMIGLILFSISVDYIRILRIVTLIFFLFTCYRLQFLKEKKCIIIYDLFLALILFVVQMKLYGLNLSDIFSNINL